MLVGSRFHLARREVTCADHDGKRALAHWVTQCISGIKPPQPPNTLELWKGIGGLIGWG